MILLSILIPTTPDRSDFVFSLFKQFDEQLHYLDDTNNLPLEGGYIRTSYWSFYSGLSDVEVIIFEDDKRHSIGYKRNFLKSRAVGKYLAFVDSDDRIGEKYFSHAFNGIENDVDCCGLSGIITEDGKNHKKFIHSLEFDSWFEKDNVYYRNPNHLNVVKSSIAKQMTFPEVNQGEDHSYSKQLHASGLLKTEYWERDEIIYHYDYRSNK